MFKRVLILGILLIAAIGVGWLLLRPLAHPHRAPVSEATETVEPTETPAEPTETPAEPASTAAQASSTPSASPATPAPAGSGPRVAVIIDDCGQWLEVERGFIKLPVPLTLSVLPHVHGSAVIAEEANAAGKGVMLHLPMETVSGLYPGPGEVTTKMSDDQVRAQVTDDLQQVPLAQGVNNHEGSKASADERVMHDVIAVLAEHGNMFFIDSRTSAQSVGENVAAAAGVPTASRDVFLDNKENVSYTEGQLREAITIAKRSGSAIAIGHPRATTLAALTAMLPEFQSEGVQLVLARELTR